MAVTSSNDDDDDDALVATLPHAGCLGSPVTASLAITLCHSPLKERRAQSLDTLRPWRAKISSISNTNISHIHQNDLSFVSSQEVPMDCDKSHPFEEQISAFRSTFEDRRAPFGQ